MKPKDGAAWLVKASISDVAQVEAPQLERLCVTVPAPAAVSEEEIFNRLGSWALLADESRSTPRAAGELLQPGDDVRLEVVCVCAGRVVPLSAYGPLWVPWAETFSVGVAPEWLVTVRVGEALDVEVTLPEGHWDPRVAGRLARVVGCVTGARARVAVAFDTDEFWQRTGRFASLSAATAAAVEAVDQERTSEAWLSALHSAWDLLLERVKPDISNGAVDRELTVRWERGDAETLRRLRVEPSMLEESREAWLTSQPLRQAARRSLAISCLSQAIAQRDAITLDPQRLEPLALSFGFDAGLLAKALQLQGQETLQTFMALAVAEHLMKHVEVKVAPRTT